MRRKINFFQLVEILDGFGGTFLGVFSLLIKQQRDIQESAIEADSFARTQYEQVDGFETVNLNHSFFASEDVSKLFIHYLSRRGNEYVFEISLENCFPYGGKSHQITFPKESALSEFIKKVSRSKGKHPNPLFRKKR